MGRRSAENALQPWAADPSLLQLLPLMALRAEAASTGLAAHRAEGSAQTYAFIRHALVLRETARRTGEVETLGRAASAALRARELARNDRKAQALALISHSQVLYVGATLFGDDAAAKIAGERLNEAAKLPLDPAGQARLDALRAGLLSREALSARSPAVCKAAGAALTNAAKGLDTLAKLGKLDDSEAHEVRCERAELLIGAAVRSQDR